MSQCLVLPVRIAVAFGVLYAVTAASPGASQPDILQQAYEAHGGAVLDRAATLEFRVRVIDRWAHQSRRPGPPWDASSGYRWHMVDFPARRYARQTHMRNAGFYSFYDRSVVDGDNAYRIDLLEKYWRPIPGGPDSFHAQTLEAKLVLAPWIIADAAAHRSGEAARTVEIEGRELIRIGASLTGGPEVTLYFDSETKLLARMSRADEPAVYLFRDYSARAGMQVNATTVVRYRGDPVLENRLITFAIDTPLNPDFFRIPEDIGRLNVEVDPDARGFRVRELDPGVWFVGAGVFYQLFVEFDSFVVAVGGIEGASTRIAAIAERTGGKPLRYAIVTHHHSDHLEGVVELAAAGATIIVAAGNEAVTRAALGDVTGEIETVSDRHTVTDGNRVLDIYQIGPGAHAEAMLAVHLPEQKILYTGDLLVQPPGRPMRARIPPIRDLVIAIETFGLEVERHLDPHSPRVTTIGEIYEALYN